MMATHTTEGAIPHLRIVTEYGIVHAPVKLVTAPNGRGHMRVVIDETAPSHQRFPSPMRRDGKLVFALPGGLEVLR